MRIDFTEKTVVVTGASRGIGRTVAELFESAGARVLAPSRETMDVASPEAVGRFFSEARGVDVLVNNAGIYPVTPLVDLTPEEWHEVVDANLTSVHLCTRAAARAMIDRKTGGAIVNITSTEASSTAPGHSHYSASKAAVVAYTRSSAMELGPHGIRVNAVSPGLIRREGIEKDWPEGVSSFLQRAPLRRLGTPEDVAHACLFLASSEASFITGANLVVDGGVLCAPAF